jgi:hypothetical protein
MLNILLCAVPVLVVVDYPNIINVSNSGKSVNEEENVNSENLIEVVDADEQYEDDDILIEISNTTCINSSQDDQLIFIFKCQICDFVSGRKTCMTDHKPMCHTWCSFCYSS